MDVRMPDGTVIKGVPEGYSQEDLMDQYQQHTSAAAAPRVHIPTTEEVLSESMGPLVRGAAGVGHGVLSTAGKVANMLSGGRLVTDEELVKDKKDWAPITNTTAGAVGNFGGEVLATAPLSGAAKLAGRGISALSNGGRAATLASRVLGSGVANGVVDGAVQSGVLADPGQRGEATLEGGAAGGALNLLARGAGRVIKGLIGKSEEAQRLESLARMHGEDMFIPLSLTADDSTLSGRIAKAAYKQGLSIVPGAAVQLKNQAEGASQTARRIALQEAAPEGFTIPHDAGNGQSGNKISDWVGKIKEEFDRRYQSHIGDYTFNIPDAVTFGNQIKQRILAAHPTMNDADVGMVTGMLDQELAKYSNGKDIITGDNLLNAKNAASRLFDDTRIVKGGVPAVRALSEASKVFDDIIETELAQQGAGAGTKTSSPAARQAVEDLKQYRKLGDAWRGFAPVLRASDNAANQGGEFTMAQYGNALPKPRPGQPKNLREFVNDAVNVLGPAAAQDTQAAGRGALGLATGAGGLGVSLLSGTAFPVGAGILGTVGLGNAMAMKGAQKALTGDTGTQQLIAKLLREHPELVLQSGKLGRGAVSVGIGESHE